MTTVLALSNGHDANTALAIDGELVAVLEKERFSRHKHATGQVIDLAERLLRTFGRDWSSVDLIAVSPPVWPEFGCDWNLDAATPARASETVRTRILVGDSWYDALVVPHHLAHAASAYYVSGIRESAVLTWDGGGNHCDASRSIWKDGALHSLEPLDGFHLGSLWSVVSERLFGDIFAAGKVMGLAASGQPSPEISGRWKSLGILGDAPLSVARSWGMGEALVPETRWWLQECCDVAATLQATAEERCLEVAQSVAAWSGQSNLCVSGGLALNGYINSQLSLRAPFEHVFAPPAPHDGGLSIGLALLGSAELGIAPTLTPISPFLGLDESGCVSGAGPLDDRTLSETVERLSRGEVIGVCRGRAEIGPRALGSRSVLASLGRPWLPSMINTRVKRREAFRPIAPVIRHADASRFMKSENTCNEWMTKIGELSEEGLEALGSVAHLDNTVRAQVVPEGTFLHDVIDGLEALGHVPAVANTSFNQRGEPLVNLADEARSAARELRLDGLLIGDVLE